MAKSSQNKSARETMMLTEPMSKIIPKLAIPTIIAFLINSIYSLADTYFVSSLGTNATAAVSVNNSLDQLIMMAGSLLAIGANSYIARLLGARQKEEASRVLSTCFFLAMGIGAFIMVAGIAFMEPMVRLLGATDTCMQYSIDYATYVLYAAPFMAANFVMNQCLRSEGSAMLSMIGMGFGGILNCFLDPIFIFNLNMGVAGASLATAISKLVSFAILIFPYITRRSMLHLSIKKIHIKWSILEEVISIGTPSMCRTGLSVISGILINNVAGGISDSVLAGIGVSTKVMMFPMGLVLGFSNGFQPVSGFNWGAKRFDRVRDSYTFSAKVSVIGSIITGFALAFFAPQVISLFTKTDPDMLALGSLCIRLQCIVLPVHAWVTVVNMFCGALGYARYAFILATTRQGTCFMPILYPMAYIFGSIGVVSVQAVADVLSIIPAIPIIKKMYKTIDTEEQKFLQESNGENASLPISENN